MTLNNSLLNLDTMFMFTLWVVLDKLFVCRWTWKPTRRGDCLPLYVAETCPEATANFIHLAPTHLAELDHMRILHKAGILACGDCGNKAIAKWAHQGLLP